MIKKKICLIIPSLNSGGMQRVMNELSVFFCQKIDIEVHLIMYGIYPEIFYTIPQNLIIHQPGWKFDNSKRIWNTVKRLNYLRQTVKMIVPDTILSFGEYWNSFVLLSLTGLRYPIYISDRCQPNKNLGFVHEYLRKWLYPKATGIIAQTNVAKKIYSKLFHHPNIQVIGNPIRIIENKSDNIIRENIVLTVGRLIPSKHHDILIDIFVKIAKPDWKLVIIGGDANKQNEMERLTVKISKLHIEDQVILTGNISNVDDYYLRSKIFAFTSSSEGFPNVIGEAMSAGLPVIAFDCIAGPSEMIVDGENGYLIPLYDENNFEFHLRKMIEDNILIISMGNKAKTQIKKFDAATISKQYYDFIIQLIPSFNS